MSSALYAVIMLVIGIFLIGIEVAIIPGVGFVGFIGGVALLYGGYIAYASYGVLWGVLSLVVSAGSTISLIYLASRLGIMQRLVLETQTGGQPSDLPGREAELVGKKGVALSDLRPAGVASFGGKRCDVVSADAEYIESGAAIVVVEIDQNSVVVNRDEGEQES